MGTSIADLITAGTIPARPFLINNADRLAWERDTADYFIGFCRDHTRTDVWVDSNDGDDSNDGLTISTPKQTLTAALALLGDNVRINVKAGSVFKSEAATLDHAGCSMERYGEGANPLLWRPELIASSWTNTTGAQYSTTVVQFDTALVLVGDPDDPDQRETIKDQPYQRVFSTTAMPEGSYHQSGQTLTVRLYGDVDPGTVEVWRAHRTLTAPAASGIEITNVDRVYVEGIDVIGFGRDIADQLYNIRSLSRDTTVHAIVDCNAHYNTSHHTIGHYVSGTGQSGGITVWKDVEYGYCTHDSEGNSTIFVDYSIGGLQTLFMVDCLCDGGQIGYASNGAGTNAINKTFPAYMHTNTLTRATYASFVGHTTRTRAGNKIAKSIATDASTFAVPTTRYDETGEYAGYTCVIFDEVYDEGQIPTGNFVGMTQVDGVVRIGSNWGELFLTEVGTVNGAILGPMRGLIVNSRATFIAEAVQAAQVFGIFYGGTAETLSRLGLIYSHWKYVWTGDSDTGGLKTWTNASGGQATQLVASILEYGNLTDPTRATFAQNRLNLAPNGAPAFTGANGTGGQLQCAYIRVRPDTAGGYTGFNNSSDPLDLTATLGIGTTEPTIDMDTPPEATSPLVGHADAVPSYLRFTHDANGVLRSRNTVGPFEVVPIGGGSAIHAMAYYRRRRRLRAQGNG